jgi:hypothetical protein
MMRPRPGLELGIHAHRFSSPLIEIRLAVLPQVKAVAYPVNSRPSNPRLGGRIRPSAGTSYMTQAASEAFTLGTWGPH